MHRHHYNYGKFIGELKSTLILSAYFADTSGKERTKFQELLSYVDKKYHLLLTLFYADEYTIPEIAKMLDMNENTVKTQLRRARQQIRRGLDEEDKLS